MNIVGGVRCKCKYKYFDEIFKMKIWFDLLYLTSFSVSAISWRPVCESSAPFIVIYKAGCEPKPYWW